MEKCNHERKYEQSLTTIIPSWINKYESAKAWLAKINGVKAHRALFLWHFCDWAKLNPNQLLSLKDSYENLEAERLLDKFCRDAPLPEATRKNAATSVRSFFRINYRQLQSEAGRMELSGVREQRSPRKQARKQLILRGCFNERDRAVIMMTTTTAIALETLSKLRWSHFEENWQNQKIPHISIPPELLKGHGKGKYRNVRQETFITPETKMQLLAYREEFEKRFGYKWKDTDNVFLISEEDNRPMSYQALRILVQRIAKRADVKFSIHDGRRIVQTALESVGCPSNWTKKIKGRKCSGEESPYSKPNIEQLRSKYAEALEELEFLSNDTANVKKLEELEVKVEERNGAIAELLTDSNKQRLDREKEIEVLKVQLNGLQQQLSEFIAAQSRLAQGIPYQKPTVEISEQEKDEAWKKLFPSNKKLFASEAAGKPE